MAKVTNDPAAVRLQLDSVNRRIEKHPLNSEKFTRARALMQESSVEHRETVSAALREQGLPEIGTQMRMMLFGLGSLARLNRRRLRLDAALSQNDQQA